LEQQPAAELNANLNFNASSAAPYDSPGVGTNADLNWRSSEGVGRNTARAAGGGT
jgi:hypothetical protein